MRNSSSPPNSTGSTADSDGWEHQTLGFGLSSPDEPQNRFAGFKRPSSEDFDSQKRPKSAGLLLEGRKKADKKKKKKKLRKCNDEELGSFTPSPPSSVSFGCTIKEEPEDYLSIPVPTAGSGAGAGADQPERAGVRSTPACKEEPDAGRPCWDGYTSSDSKSEEPDQATVSKFEGVPGKRTVIRQGKQVVFRDEDGSGDDEDIMVDSGNYTLSKETPLRSDTRSCSISVMCR